MESLEDFDVVRELNFRSSRRFLRLAEEDLAALLLLRAGSFESGGSFESRGRGEASSAGLGADAGADAGQDPPPLRSRRFVLSFPPLKPKFAQLLHATVVRFDLPFTLQGWGDERHLIVEASSSSSSGPAARGRLPVVRYDDFLVGLTTGLLPSLAQLPPAEIQLVVAPVLEPVVAEQQASHRASASEGEVPPKRETTPPAKRQRGGRFGRGGGGGGCGGGGGMRGWSSEESEGSEAEATKDGVRPRAAGGLPQSSGLAGLADGSAAHTAGRVMRGRGFLPDEGEMSSSTAAAGEEEALVRCVLRGDYGAFAIDPEDNWRPHRKPYVELQSQGWEFSKAWSFEPEARPPSDAKLRLERMASRRDAEADNNNDKESCGVMTWRIEHASLAGLETFQVAFGGQPQEMRRWLSGREGRAEEEPYVLEFRMITAERRWDFRFARASKLLEASWKHLPWSVQRQSVFWAASFVGRLDGKRYLHAGLDEFPGRRFFSARLAAPPRVFGFGLPKQVSAALYIRDIAVFGKASLQGAPFAGRDHFLEASLSVEEVEAAVRKAGVHLDVLRVLPLGEAAGKTNEVADSGVASTRVLVVCSSAERAKDVAEALGEARQVPGCQRTWPPPPTGGDEPPLSGAASEAEAVVQKASGGPPGGGGPELAKRFLEGQAQLWRSLHGDTLREMGLFQEHLERKTQHLEGTRLARNAAARIISANSQGHTPRANETARNTS
ncbi:unnamed protein product [Polarella glacialis]|uniref:Uncharacterized protein n=1 Tax=Polarella glacialis TaxID=89957 RepID=A0A813IDJ3_POLGL|nr:unnamed protein product [Polarella glacialis]CAE8648359.1 unnamed protein product [Polarella glacialis]